MTEKWYLVDAKDKILGRVATQVAAILRGKHKSNFAPNIDRGDFVIVINAKDIKVTGNKLQEKYYFRHSGYIDGDKTEVLGKLFKRKPTDVFMHAVAGMLPKTKLGKKMIKKLRVYAGAEHEHKAQKPEVLKV